MVKNNIRLLRTTKNMSQVELAELLGVAQQTICSYENNARQPPVHRLLALSRVFDTSIDELINDEPVEPVTA